MPHLDRLRPLASPRGRASRQGLPAHALGRWTVDAGWIEHRAGHQTRRLPVDVALAALERVAAAGALRADGTVDPERVRGVRAHHPVHGRFHVELRSSRWELAWLPRGGAAQRLPLAGVAEHFAPRDGQYQAAA